MFEFFFKYPRAVYEQGHFALLGAWPKWSLLLLILAAALALAWLIRRRLASAAPLLRSWRAWVLWALQTLLAALVLVLLWQPAITIAELRPQGELFQPEHNSTMPRANLVQAEAGSAAVRSLVQRLQRHVEHL